MIRDTLWIMIKGSKQEYECIANRVSRLTRDVEYYLEINHPRKLARNDFGAKVVSHETVDDWDYVLVKEIILERGGEYCLVNYYQNKNKHSRIMASPCIYVAEPVTVQYIQEEV